MPDSKSISELTTGEQITGNDLFETAIPNGSLGYLSRKHSLSEMAVFIAITQQYSTHLQTSSKTLVGAINEIVADIIEIRQHFSEENPNPSE